MGPATCPILCTRISEVPLIAHLEALTRTLTNNGYCFPWQSHVSCSENQGCVLVTRRAVNTTTSKLHSYSLPELLTWASSFKQASYSFYLTGLSQGTNNGMAKHCPDKGFHFPLNFLHQLTMLQRTHRFPQRQQ